MSSNHSPNDGQTFKGFAIEVAQQHHLGYIHFRASGNVTYSFENALINSQNEMETEDFR